jgi:translation elongation factor EF-1beta
MMKNKLNKTLAVLVFVAITAVNGNAQTLKVPAPSPTQTLKQNFGLSEISIEYSRPSAKSRVIYGDLVPYGKVWRTGANSATKITFGEDVTLEGKAVKAGTYALYSVPNKDSWEIMLYSDMTLGGNVAEYKSENEVVRVKVKPTSLTEKVETFSINVANITPKTAQIELCWENTRAAFGISVDIDDKIMKNIETTMSKDGRPYHQAASYYYDNDKDLKTALDWADKAFQINPKAYWSAHLKAKIQMKMNDKKGAIETAEKSLALAKEGKDDTYVKMNETLIADAKK